MKSVLLSVQPKWCELIASGEKTIEVRKTKPKVETPFKVYIYCTKPKERLYRVFNKEDYRGYPGFEEMKDDEKVFIRTFCDSDDYLRLPMCSQVIGEFVCDDIEYFNYGIQTPDDATSYWDCYEGYPDWTRLVEQSQVPLDELSRYGNKKGLFGWHISDLVIYDEPKELSEFKKLNRSCYYSDLGLAIPECEKCKDPACMAQKAPQSWYYVEEMRGEN